MSVTPRTDGRSTYVNVDEAAAILGRPAQTVRDYMRKGRLRGVKFGPRLWRVERASLEAVQPTAVPAPEPTPYERVLAELPALSADERKRLAIAALTVA